MHSNYTGSIYKIPFPFTDLTTSKARPALAISEPDSHGDIQFLFITTKQTQSSAVVIDIPEKLLPYASHLHVNKIFLLHKDIIQKKLAAVPENFLEQVLRKLALTEAERYYDKIHKPGKNKPFVPGKSRINYAGRVFDEKEIVNLVDSSLDFWLTTGRYAEQFEKDFAGFLGVKYCSLVNSGSSANLLAFMALTSPKLGERRINKGDEVITVAAGFPTTVAPIVQYGAVPVFVDITLPTYNIDCSQLEEALSEKTKAVMLAHTLGNPFDLKAVKSFCDKNNLWLIEDNCDALGSRYAMEEQEGEKMGRCEDVSQKHPRSTTQPHPLAHSPTHPHNHSPSYKHTGTIGDIGTSSFYPPHHITMGEGGAVYTNDVQLKQLVESFRDWGRDCWCPSGRDNTCKKRFDQQFGELPMGYDHKYVYSHFGYNLKVTDMQAAIGCAQLEKLPSFIGARKRNWQMLRDGLAGLEDKFILPEPTPNSDPSWFGFLLTIRENAGISRDRIVNHLEEKGIQTRMLFAGNLLKHPCFDEMRKTGQGYRIVSPTSPSHRFTLSPSPPLPVTDRIMRDTFWVGVYPGMTDEMLRFMVEAIVNFVKGR